MQKYSDLIDRLLLQPNLMQVLCPSEPLDYDWVRRVQEADEKALLGESEITDQAAVGLVRGGVLYAVDALEPAHALFQEHAGDLGAYWHGMLHRREGDFDNARYWFRRAGRLAFFDRLHSVAAEHSAVMARQSTWDPYLMTGECEQTKHGSEEAEKLPQLQRAEWDEVFAYTWRQATRPE